MDLPRLFRRAQVSASLPPLEGGRRAPSVVDGTCPAQDAFEAAKAPPASSGTYAADKLAALGALARRAGSDGVLVMQHGQVVYEWYRPGVGPETALDTFSAAKTVTSALVGAAIARGAIQSIDQRVSDFVPEWAGEDDPRRELRLRDILSGMSGLDTDAYPEEAGAVHYLLNLASDYYWAIAPGAWLHPDQTAFGLGARLTHAPGTQWKYNNRAIQVLEAVLERATGTPLKEFAREALWGPLGVDGQVDWKTDAAGNPTTYSSVQASLRNLARFGELLRNGGAWGGQQLLDPTYVQQMRERSPVNPAYGLLTWLNPVVDGYRGIDNRWFEGQPFPAMGEDYFSAQGMGGNFIGVDPSTETVVVHARRAPHERPFSNWPWKLVDELLHDADQTLHREMLERLVAART